MSLLGLDVGTTGCKASVFSETGDALASAYVEYDIRRPEPGWAELDAHEVWRQVKRTIAAAATQAATDHPDDPIRSLSVSSLGEATVPVAADRAILGPSILNMDARGEEFLPGLASALDEDWLYRVNGNVLGNHYSLTKLLWVQRHQPELYERTWKFLHWGSFVSFMLGADPGIDYSLANRSLLFDVDARGWSDDAIARTGLTREKLPEPAPSGTCIGTVADAMANELGLPHGVAISTGAHDQCANAVGCGVLGEGSAMFGMGTFVCIVPVFSERREPGLMIPRGLNTEHHAAPGQFVSFIYNQGGGLVKWFRDTYAAVENAQAKAEGRDVYDSLLTEVPDGPSSVFVLPHFDPTGPPEFITDSAGVVAGLHLDTTRGQILKGILEGTTYYLRECVDELPATGTTVTDYRAVGGGSKSDVWVQLCADILGRPFVRPVVTEAGALGAAILGGLGNGTFSSPGEAVEHMVRLDRSFDPDPAMHELHTDRFGIYRQMWPLMQSFLRGLPR